jgi:hypothetical protein
MANASHDISRIASFGIAAARRKQKAAGFAFGVAVIRQGSAFAHHSMAHQTGEISKAERLARRAYLAPQLPAEPRPTDPITMGTISIFIDVRVQVQNTNTIFVNVWDLIVVSIFNSDVTAADVAEAAAAEAADVAEAAAAEAADVAADVLAADVVDVVDLLVL